MSKNPVVQLPEPFVDDRGSIQPLLNRPLSSCLLISSEKGSVRANHYHKTDWHYCYVISGAIEYHFRGHGSIAVPDRCIVPAGSMVFTPPMVDHAMKFPEDTVFIAMSRNSRHQQAYENDVVRVHVVD